MSIGIDANQNIAAYAGALKAAGYTFVCRYIKPQEPTETLTLPEAQHLSEEELDIVSIVELGSPTCGSHFTADRGAADAHTAINYADGLLGQPSDAPLYYTVDYDAPEGDMPGIIDYFTAARAVHQAHQANGGAWYPLGVYGSGAVCQELSDRGLVEYTWPTESRAYRGTMDYLASGKWSMHQTHEGTFCGVDVDFNVSQDDAGGWKL